MDLGDKHFQNQLMPEATENMLVLAKKLQEKYVRSKINSDEFLNLFRSLMSEFGKTIASNKYLAIQCEHNFLDQYKTHTFHITFTLNSLKHQR